MINQNELQRLMQAFPDSFLNANLEFIAYEKTNLYFILHNCETELDVKCKVLEWFSRDACKTQVYRKSKNNDIYHKYIRNCINDYLKTNYTEEQMSLIYTKLGNAVNHNLTREFVCSDYDFKLLEKQNDRN